MATDRDSIAGLYIHIPFCRSKCGYCDFYSITDETLVVPFLITLKKEMDFYRGEFDIIDTVYFGGGTPSLLSVEQIGDILRKAGEVFQILPDAEVTVEMNPADWGAKELAALREIGVNRISIGVQSFRDDDLLLLGRRHSGKQARDAVSEAANAGFVNIGMDLIYGLPMQTPERWRASLAEAIDFNLAHLSCYQLEIKTDTPLGMKYERGIYSPLAEEEERDYFMMTSEILEKAGFIHYEISNFAQGAQNSSRHNRKYWKHTPYLGLGVSSHSFLGSTRWSNCASVGDYFRLVAEGRRPVANMERLSAHQLALEAFFLGLRMKEGIDLDEHRKQYGIDIVKEKGELLKGLITADLVALFDGSIRPTRAGMAVADGIALL